MLSLALVADTCINNNTPTVHTWTCTNKKKTEERTDLWMWKKTCFNFKDRFECGQGAWRIAWFPGPGHSTKKIGPEKDLPSLHLQWLLTQGPFLENVFMPLIDFSKLNFKRKWWNNSIQILVAWELYQYQLTIVGTCDLQPKMVWSPLIANGGCIVCFHFQSHRDSRNCVKNATACLQNTVAWSSDFEMLLTNGPLKELTTMERTS